MSYIYFSPRSASSHNFHYSMPAQYKRKIKLTDLPNFPNPTDPNNVGKSSYYIPHFPNNININYLKTSTSSHNFHDSMPSKHKRKVKLIKLPTFPKPPDLNDFGKSSYYVPNFPIFTKLNDFSKSSYYTPNFYHFADLNPESRKYYYNVYANNSSTSGKKEAPQNHNSKESRSNERAQHGYANVNHMDDAQQKLKSAYEILGLNPGDDANTITKTYRKLALKYHPDKNCHKGIEEVKRATEKFQELSNAYKLLVP